MRSLEEGESTSENRSARAWEGMDLLPVGICIVDDSLTVRYWNACLEEWTGTPAAEIVGQKVTEHFPGLKKAGFIDRIEQVLQGGAPTVFSSQIHTCLIPSHFPDGTIRVQRTTLIPLETGDKGRFDAMFVCEDVSALTQQVKSYRAMRNQTLHELEERRKVELELRAANEDLRAYFAEHTSRLTEPLSGAAADLEAILQEMEAEERDSDAVREKLRDAIGTIRTTEKRLTELIEVARKEQQDVGQEQGYFMPQTIQGSYRP
ncbi:PAS sensor protein [Methanofollis liminatans DSM 4140]|uniref:PAS sensor protein n=2 Tax=Methanofollis liminatans TaxID=2201 RepID=J1L0I8_9EURY|nr:PAS sensor protein [Methanofollis liminatans DSM 4140]